MKDITRHDNGDAAEEQIQKHVARKQRLLQKVRDANSCTREQDTVYVDKLTNEVWVNVPFDREYVTDTVYTLLNAGYECVNHVPSTDESDMELILKYEA